MNTRRMIHITLGLLIGALTDALGPSVAMAEEQIVIEGAKLNPPALKTTVGERVTFVNRSGGTVHVDFIGNSGRHETFQVPTEIWAIFHRPGLHPYEVHFSDPKAVTLRGTVEALEDPSKPGAPTTCDSFTVMGVCIAR